MRWVDRLRGRQAGGDRPIALTRWFAGVGALAIGLFSLAMGWQLSSYLERRMLERDAALSRDFVQSIANIQQVAGFLRAPRGDPAPSVAEFFAHVAAMPDVIRANVYAPDRRVIWSSRAELIGQRFGANDELDAALRGAVVVNREDDEEGPDKSEHEGLRRSGTPFIENYLPVYSPEAGGALLGVIELYRQPVALFEAIAAGQLRIRVGSAVGGLFLFAVLVWFVRHTERDLQEQQRRLVEAETLAAVGELAAAVAHSIRNPLGSIRSTAELHREVDGDADGRHAETIASVDRIERLVRTLLSYARDPGDREAHADLAPVLREAARRFEADLSGHGRTLEVELAADVGTVRADPVALAQVFNSLLANAAEATGAGDTVRLAAWREGDWAVVELRDTGSGIAPERLRQIFRPFFTTKPRGLGLGLPLARRLVQRAGGQLDVASAADEGTCVRVRLPLEVA